MANKRMFINKKASIEMHKVVIWVISILVALAILTFMITQLNHSTGGSLMNQTLERLFDI